MSDYARGAIEALIWVDGVLERALAMGWSLRQVKLEAELMKEGFMREIAERFCFHAP